MPMTAFSSVTSSQTASTNTVIEQGISMFVIVAIVIVWWRSLRYWPWFFGRKVKRERSHEFENPSWRY
jgi:hypothetical protein